MSDSKKQWSNIPNRKKKKPYNSKRDTYKKKENLKETFPVFKTNNNFQSKNDLNTHSTNAFSALVWRKPNVSSTIPTILTNTIYEKAKKGFIELNSYPVLSTSPTFPMFQ
jgi:hypothetical protein